MERPDRRRDLDRLRVVACLSTFCYHAVQVFDLNPYYHLKSNTPSQQSTLRRNCFTRFGCRCSSDRGMVGYLALQKYTDSEFMKQRARRLLPPFLIGIILFTPAIKYFELLDGRHISWRGIAEFSGGMPDLSVFLRRHFTQPKWFSWSHMWFLLYLFLLGGAMLPVLRAMARSDWPKRLPSWLILGLPLLALIAVELALRPYFPWHIPNLFWDWASMMVYVITLCYGAALIRWPVLEGALQRLLPLVAVLTALGVYLYLGNSEGPFHAIGRALTLWGALGLMVGLGPSSRAVSYSGRGIWAKRCYRYMCCTICH